MDEERLKVLNKGATLVGHTKYRSKEYSNEIKNAPEKPDYLCCSSFVSWAFWKSGVLKVDYAVWKFLDSDKFEKIKEKDAKPGDLAFLHFDVERSKNSHDNHIGFYLGKDDSGRRTYLHCTGNNANGVVVNNDTRFNVSYYLRWRGYKD